MKRALVLIGILLIASVIGGCAKSLAQATHQTMKPYTAIVPSDPNTIYYATKWAMDQCGYPEGPEDLPAGVIESKWVPTGAGSHYIETVAD